MADNLAGRCRSQAPNSSFPFGILHFQQSSKNSLILCAIMSSFGPKRKARIIQTFEDGGDDLKAASGAGDEEQSDQRAS
jgi:hypothetical protein